MAAKAHQSVDADPVAQGEDENSVRRHLSAIADSSGHTITIGLTPDGGIETWNQSAERLYGYAQAH